MNADLNTVKNVAYRYICETGHDYDVDDPSDGRSFDVLSTKSSHSGVRTGHTSRVGRAENQPVL